MRTLKYILFQKKTFGLSEILLKYSKIDYLVSKKAFYIFLMPFQKTKSVLPEIYFNFPTRLSTLVVLTYILILCASMPAAEPLIEVHIKF